MINRCKYCSDICPDFSDICDTCAHIESECKDDFLQIEWFIHNDPLNYIPEIKDESGTEETNS